MLNMYKILAALAIVSMSLLPVVGAGERRPVYLMPEELQLLPGRSPAALKPTGRLLGPEWRPRSGSWSVMDHGPGIHRQPAWDLGVARIQGFYDLKAQDLPGR